MANREMERYTTRAYTTSEGVNVIEEHLRFPLRKETPDRPLEAKDICEFDLVTFEKSGRTPVFFVRESEWNQCEDRKLTRYVDGVVYGELTDRRRDLSPEEVALYLERKTGGVNQVPYFSPPLGEGRCDRDDEQQASRKAVDLACKQNLGCKENLVTQHLQTQDISKENLFETAKQEGKQSPAQLWKKLESLEQEPAQEANQARVQEAEQAKKR